LGFAKGVTCGKAHLRVNKKTMAFEKVYTCESFPAHPEKRLPVDTDDHRCSRMVLRDPAVKAAQAQSTARKNRQEALRS
jgi:hypothetical protein